MVLFIASILCLAVLQASSAHNAQMGMTKKGTNAVLSIFRPQEQPASNMEEFTVQLAAKLKVREDGIETVLYVTHYDVQFVNGIIMVRGEPVKIDDGAIVKRTGFVVALDSMGNVIRKFYAPITARAYTKLDGDKLLVEENIILVNNEVVTQVNITCVLFTVAMEDGRMVLRNRTDFMVDLQDSQLFKKDSSLLPRTRDFTTDEGVQLATNTSPDVPLFEDTLPGEVMPDSQSVIPRDDQITPNFIYDLPTLPDERFYAPPPRGFERIRWTVTRWYYMLSVAQKVLLWLSVSTLALLLILSVMRCCCVRRKMLETDKQILVLAEDLRDPVSEADSVQQGDSKVDAPKNDTMKVFLY